MCHSAKFVESQSHLIKSPFVVCVVFVFSSVAARQLCFLCLFAGEISKINFYHEWNCVRLINNFCDLLFWLPILFIYITKILYLTRFYFFYLFRKLHKLKKITIELRKRSAIYKNKLKNYTLC